MLTQKLKIGEVPAALYGAESDKVFLFVHGKNGCKEEAAVFAETASRFCWQVLGIDLPEHGERKTGSLPMLPWNVVPELQGVMAYLKQHWHHLAVRANSIGAWFSMLSFAKEPLEKCLFVSPILNMEKLIQNMMMWASVTEEQLQKEGEIQTAFGETLSFEYLTYVRSHIITGWNHPTSILYPGQDNLTDRATAEAFANRHHAKLTVMENGEHWFHTEEQLAYLKQWTEAELLQF